MPWLYSISRHTFSFPGLPDFSNCYSGGGIPPNFKPEAKNNPAFCGITNVGPLTPGTYTMTELRDEAKTGPDTIVLMPDEATAELAKALNRDGYSFRIHGDAIDNPGQASEACPVAPRDFRVNLLWGGADKTIIVVP